jgi:hypothetical protein
MKKQTTKKRSSYLGATDVELGQRGITVWGCNTAGQVVCRLGINSAGLAIYAGKKKLGEWNWDNLVKEFKKRGR